MIDRYGQVWVGSFDNQGAYLVLWPDEIVDGDERMERFKALDLQTGKVTHLITKGIEMDVSWTRYR